jgi:hypothetical protein
VKQCVVKWGNWAHTTRRSKSREDEASLSERIPEKKLTKPIEASSKPPKSHISDATEDLLKDGPRGFAIIGAPKPPFKK